jgi:hypothetical protein
VQPSYESTDKLELYQVELAYDIVQGVYRSKNPNSVLLDVTFPQGAGGRLWKPNLRADWIECFYNFKNEVKYKMLGYY